MYLNLFSNILLNNYIMNIFFAQDKLDPILEQRFLRHCQDEVLDKLRKAIPKPSVHSEIMDSFEDGTLFEYKVQYLDKFWYWIKL